MSRPQRSSQSPPRPTDAHYASGVSPLVTPPNSRWPAAMGHKGWLHRATSNPIPTGPNATLRVMPIISNPIPLMTLDTDDIPAYADPPTHDRGVLGAGATKVKEPKDAFHLGPARQSGHRCSVEQQPASRPKTLPPIPDSETCDRGSHGHPPARPSHPSRPPPAVPELSALKPAVPGSSEALLDAQRPSILSPPPLHVSVDDVSMPEFAPLLLVPLPTAPIPDPSRVIVSLDISTTTYRTTMSTLMSRPSKLAKYLQEIIAAASADSAQSDTIETPDLFDSIFLQKVKSTGVFLTTSHVHIFLDRPGRVYEHILAYLRAPPEGPVMLPRAVRLGSNLSSHLELETLLDMRDEASYLDLKELHALCCEEVRQRLMVFPRSYAEEMHPHETDGLGSWLHRRRVSASSSESSYNSNTSHETVDCETVAGDGALKDPVDADEVESRASRGLQLDLRLPSKFAARPRPFGFF